jgi:hypothetical protein
MTGVGKNRWQLDQLQWANASIEFPFAPAKHIEFPFAPAKHIAGHQTV